MTLGTVARAARATTLAADDRVLFGERGVAKPRDWRIGRVIIASEDLVVVEPEDADHRRPRSIPPADVIAVTRRADWLLVLMVTRQWIEMRLTPLLADVLAGESRLAAARGALWAAIDAELGMRAPLVDDDRQPGCSSS